MSARHAWAVGRYVIMPDHESAARGAVCIRARVIASARARTRQIATVPWRVMAGWLNACAYQPKAGDTQYNGSSGNRVGLS